MVNVPPGPRCDVGCAVLVSFHPPGVDMALAAVDTGTPVPVQLWDAFRPTDDVKLNGRGYVSVEVYTCVVVVRAVIVPLSVRDCVLEPVSGPVENVKLLLELGPTPEVPDIVNVLITPEIVVARVAGG
jgi:hypothetical protein